MVFLCYHSIIEIKENKQMKLVKLTTIRGDYKEIKASSIEEVKTGGLIVRDALTGVKKSYPKNIIWSYEII